jgi:hypothetical protein
MVDSFALRAERGRKESLLVVTDGNRLATAAKIETDCGLESFSLVNKYRPILQNAATGTQTSKEGHS